MEITELTAWELRDKIYNKEIRVIDVINAYLDKINKIDSKINAYVFLNPELAQKKAFEIENKDYRGLKLAGLPIAIKDNICVKDEPTTCCSRILTEFKPPYNATVIDYLEKEGAILLGKTNMDEFAFGSSTETSCYRVTRNPYNLECVPGGSSGGSAAAVSAKEALWALGSDTGGSIRQPAAFTGIVGLKPTYGRVSRYGLIAFASGLDQIGPLTRDVKDASLLLEIIAGHDRNDPTSSSEPVPSYSQNLKPKLKDVKIGVPREYFTAGLNSEIKSRIEEVLNQVQKEGAKVEWMNLPHTEYAISCYYIIAPSEASSNLARYDGVGYGLRAKVDCQSSKGNPMVEMYLTTRSEGFGAEVKRRIILGTYSLSSGYYEAYYLRAAKVRTLIKNDFKSAFKKYDCIISPTTPTPAFKIGEKITDPLQMYLCDVFTIPANLAGIPAISIPVGFTKNGLPIGIQIMADYFQEQNLLNIALAIEKFYR